MNDRIKTIRKIAGLTQSEFGERIGATRPMITSYERGVVIPPEPTIRLICREFNVSYDWLVNGNEPMMVPDERLARAKVEHILTGDNEFVKEVFLELADLPTEAWREIEEMIDRLHEKKSKLKGRP